MFTGRFSSAVGTAVETSNVAVFAMVVSPAVFAPDEIYTVVSDASLVAIKAPLVYTRPRAEELALKLAVLTVPIMFRIASPCTEPNSRPKRYGKLKGEKNGRNYSL